MPNLPDTFVIHSPAGPIMVPAWPTSGNFCNQAPGHVASPLMAPLVSTAGKGTFTVATSGKRGTVSVSAITGAAGSTSVLVSGLDATENYGFTVGLDSDNLPTFEYLSGGAAVVTFVPSGSAVGANVALEFTVQWDAEAGTATVIDHNGIAVAGTLTIGAWVTQPIITVTVSDASAPFNGTINLVQYSDLG